MIRETLQRLLAFEIKNCCIKIFGSLLSLCILVIIIYIATVILGKYNIVKAYRPSKRKVFLTSVFAIVIVLFLNSKYTARVYNMYLDCNEMKLVESEGVIDDTFPYIKGGRAVVINGATYYLFPQLGTIQIDTNYHFKYLEHSKFIVCVQDLDNPILEYNRVVPETAYLFKGLNAGPIGDVTEAREKGYAATIAYLHATDFERYKNLMEQGNTTGCYWNGWVNAYQCEFVNSTMSVHLVIDGATGIPTHFWIEENRP